MKKWKKCLAALLAAAMLLGLLAACGSGEKPSGSAAPSDGPSAAVTTAPDSGAYPLEPQELGSGEVKWSEEKTADGWMKVTNQGGETLGYSPDSGVSLIQVDGFAFKDLNKNGKLDLYEDWRQEDNARAADLASQMSIDEITGLMIHPMHSNIEADASDMTELLDYGLRFVLSGATAYPVDVQAKWNNAMQTYVEGVGHGIPVSISTNPRTAPAWPDNLGLAATFDPDVVFEAAKGMSKGYRAIGNSPQNIVDGTLSGGYDAETKKYIPISLQYGEYTADSETVRLESISGEMIEEEIASPYGVQRVKVKENRSYYGQHGNIANSTDLDAISYAVDHMPQNAKVIVAIDASNPMVVSEFEHKVDAILMGFKMDKQAVMDIVTGQYEPSALLPFQMPASMETVEAQYEDVPRDMECHVDTAGNTYDFGFGLNWSGVIQDERTAKYCVPPLTEPATQPVK
ncbi:MAG: glycoside hydrolase family 3 C-terminal domain-containing protein [Oscillospiraceae bacterium]|nr:glycoside hydrolase family 3 C-terminal domain-containing protein [Oscillospiraceae bacterium]